MSHLHCLLTFLAALSCAVTLTHSLPIAAAVVDDDDETHVTSGVPNRGSSPFSGMLMKRDLSLNQDLKSLANLLIAREYHRIRQNHRNREFLRKIGKRVGSSPSSSSAAMKELASATAAGANGGRGSDVTDLVPEDPLEALWPGFKCVDCGEEEKYGRNNVPTPLTLFHLFVRK